MTNHKAVLAALALLLAVPASRAAETNQLYRDAVKFYEKGDYDKALKSFLKVMRQDPSNAEAREYMLRCSQKIVETKLGAQAAEAVEKEIEVDKEVQQVAPDAPPALSEEFSTPILPAAPAAAVPAAPPVLPPVPAAPQPAGGIDEEIRAAAAAAAPVNARDLLSERSALTEDLRRRYLGKGNIIDVNQDGGSLDVTFYLNRLFLPLSDVLKPEAFAVLNDVRDMIRSDARRKVTFTSVDNISPAVRHTMADLSVRRTNVVFSYLLRAAFIEAPVQ